MSDSAFLALMTLLEQARHFRNTRDSCSDQSFFDLVLLAWRRQL